MRVLTAGGKFERVALASSFLEGGPSIEGLVVGGAVPLVPGPDGRFRTRSYSHVYRANPWLWAVVQLLARGLGRMPTKVYTSAEDGSKTRIRPDQSTMPGSLSWALRHPGRGRSWQALQFSTTVDRCVHGNAVWFPQRDRRGFYTGIERVPFKHVRYEEIAGVARYWDDRNPKAKRLADDVCHFGLDLDCDELFSPSPIVALHATLALYDAVERHLVAYFKNAARPSGHVEIDRTTGKDARDLIRDEITKYYTSPENAGKVLITSGKWSSITGSPDNSKVIELSKQSREEIVATYGVPPPLVGILDRAIMSNVRELRSHYARDVVGPHAALYEGDIDAQIIANDPDPSMVDVFVEVELAAVARPDPEAQAAMYKNRRYVETLNEIRGTVNLPKIDHPDADMPWMPLNEAPLGSNAPDDPDDEEPEGSLMDRGDDDDDDE